MTAEQIIKCRNALKAQRMPLESHWQELSELFMPFRAMEKGIPDILAADQLHDSSPQSAALVLANGLASLVTPREESWFEYQPPRALRKDDEAVRFYRECTDVVREYIENSNFYEEIQEAYIESGVFGTCNLFVGDLDDRGEMYFRHQPIGTYYIAEDAYGRVNCVYRDLSYTAEQAAQEFGEDKLPEKIRQKLRSHQSKTETFEFIHAVQRRQSMDDDAPEALRKPWESVVVCCSSKEVVQEGGFDSFPFAVHRYRKYGRCVWGFGPGSTAKGDARQLNFLNELDDAASEKKAFPPVIAPNTLEGEVATGSAEITYVDPATGEGSSLREWALAGSLESLKQRLAEKRAAIQEAFHVDLFKLFGMRARERGPLTATEASLIANEQTTQFSPTHGRLVSEMLDVILVRCFEVCFRAGSMPEPPASVLRGLGGDRSGLAMPAVLYKNKIVLAQQAKKNGSLVEFLGLVQPVMALYPEAADGLNLPKIVRDTARNAGLPEEWLASEKELAAKQQAREEAAMQAQQLAAAEQASKVAANVGKAPPQLLEQAGAMMP